MDEREPTETTARSDSDRPDSPDTDVPPTRPAPGAAWASRPGEAGTARGAGAGLPDADGDAEVVQPDADGDTGAGRPITAGVAGAGTPDADGDYELTRPSGPARQSSPPEPQSEAGAQPSVPRTPPSSAPGATPSESSAEPRPERAVGEETGRPEAAPPSAPDTAPPAPSADGQPVPGDGVRQPTASMPSAPPVAPAVPPVPAPSPAVPPALAGPPEPLHAPDPYGTPPYGQPGPWAPAPPVQHPATTSTPGAALPVPPVPGPDADPLVPPAPASEAAAPAPTPPAEAPHVPPVAPAGALPAPPPTPPTEAPLVPPVAPAGALPAPHPAPPGVSPAPEAGYATDAPAGAHASEAVPPGPDGDRDGDPWRRYDPWAVRPLAGGPLQESGGGLVSAERWRRRRRGRLIVGAAGIALLSGCLGGVVGAQLERDGGVGGGVRLPQAAAEPTDRAADSVAGIAARALPSVVTLHVSGSDEAGTGTGFVLDTRGHILTNDHVVAPAGSGGKISVVFNGGQTAQAEIVGRDSGYDLAVVRVTGVRGLKPLPLGNSDNVQVGDPVVAIGAPFDLEGTVTSGIISAKERPITAGGGRADGSDVSYVDALQTDAPINPGNSGGPLLDTNGRVIGINSAIRSAADGTSPDTGQAGSIGLGFAIPVNQGRRVAEELINTGRATHPVIGVTLDMDYDGDGARVGTKGAGGGAPVTEGGPADRAGIRPGDVITAVDGRPVRSGEELIVRIRAHRPGDRLELTVERDGRERAVSLVLDSPGDD
ncbi:trypsin-like peptidase domain-containing protein [Streptomyces sp. NPDC058417]|uniref:S1C family serine protease n=1 Tax=unclassified Streptomyces TaxID=2593676 RepID=UPI0036603B02